MLSACGWLLVTDEPLEQADAVVVAVDAGGAGVLEASDLVHSGAANRVAVFVDPPDIGDREFVRRGIPYEDAAARSTRQLASMGVVNVDQIPRVSGTEEEGEVLPHWCDRNGFRSVIVVTTSDHSRRLRRVLNRSMKGHLAKITIRTARYSTFNPDDWWTTRASLRIGIVELEKLFLDFVRHPIS